MKINFIFVLLFILLINSCGKKEKELSESEKKIVYFAAQTAEVVTDIEKFETQYSKNKNEKNWKYYYNRKREALDSLNRELGKIIQEVRFFERMPEENTKNLAKELIFACENIKLYLNTTNADLSNYYSTAPPAFDPYNWDRLVQPAIERLKKIMEKDKTLINSNRFKGNRYFLSQPGGEDVNRQIQSSPQKMEEWKEEVESTIKQIPDVKEKR